MIIHDVAQRSDAWFALRAGMPTASEFSKIVTSKGEPSKSAATYAITLANELYAGQPVDAWEGNAWTERGRELEDAALNWYAFVNDIELTPVGFVTDDDKTMGCSPDALAGEDGLVEVKCLKAENHTKTILYFAKHGRCPTDYVQQTQGQLIVCERVWCDLIFYHPVLPPLTIRQTQDEAVCEGLGSAMPGLLKERDRVLEVLKASAGAPIEQAA